MNKSPVTTSRGEVVGIGKVKILPSNTFCYEVPLFSFVVVKEAGGTFISTCIQLCIDGEGETLKEANESMKQHIIDFLLANFNGDRVFGAAWENLEELFLLNPINMGLWDAYRKVQVRLAKKGISTDITTTLLRRIDDLKAQIRRLKSVKEKLKKKTAQDTEVVLEFQKAA